MFPPRRRRNRGSDRHLRAHWRRHDLTWSSKARQVSEVAKRRAPRRNEQITSITQNIRQKHSAAGVALSALCTARCLGSYLQQCLKNWPERTLLLARKDPYVRPNGVVAWLQYQVPEYETAETAEDHTLNLGRALSRADLGPRRCVEMPIQKEKKSPSVPSATGLDGLWGPIRDGFGWAVGGPRRSSRPAESPSVPIQSLSVSKTLMDGRF